MDIPEALESQPLLDKLMQTRVRNLLAQPAEPRNRSRRVTMLKVFILFLLLIAGIVLGPMIAGHQGYVLIQTDNWNIETSVTGPAIILIVALLVILAVEWLLRRLFRTGARTRGWF